jgi:hypothetical protein
VYGSQAGRVEEGRRPMRYAGGLRLVSGEGVYDSHLVGRQVEHDGDERCYAIHYPPPVPDRRHGAAASKKEMLRSDIASYLPVAFNKVSRLGTL